MSKYLKPLVWVEGIIGGGKTTFSREVGKRLGFRVIEEPVDNGANPYLELFYKDPKKYAFSMQIFLLHQRYMMQVLAASEATGVGGAQGAILDRSLAGDRVFAKLHMKAGNIHELDWQTYEMAYNFMARTLLPPTLLIYLDVKPETSYERMKRRNRQAEVDVKIDYIRDLHEGYQELLKEAEHGLTPWCHAVRVYRLIWDLDINSDKQWDNVAESIHSICTRR